MRLLARGARVNWHAHEHDHVVYPAAGVISVLTVTAACSVPPLLRELLAVLAAAPPADLHERARLFAVVDDLLRADTTPVLTLPQPGDPRLMTVADRLEADPAAEHSLAILTAAAGTSPRTLTRLIDRELGLTLPQWRTQLRLAHSLLLLADGQPVTTTAHRCGWRNASSYITAFRTLFDTAPAADQRSASPP
ncbi:AraC-type DNA-binding protein [Modestobacter sp. DSM 44400]|nr:AraC-type DNA-binding protein [Modestobacter sp. DSM 44400]